jgi:hypothetical protein
MVQTISITQARNNLFDIANASYLQNEEFVVKKNDIPIIRITRYTEKCDDDRVKKQKRLLERIKKLHAGMKPMPSSTEFIRKMRDDRINKLT